MTTETTAKKFTPEEQRRFAELWHANTTFTHRQFCEQHGITRNQLTYWATKYKDAKPPSRTVSKQREYGRRSQLKRRKLLDELGLPHSTRGSMAEIQARAVQRNGAQATPHATRATHSAHALRCPNCGCDVFAELEKRLLALKAALSLDL